MSAGKMMCFDLIFYFKKKKKSAHIGPIQVLFQTESKKYIYIYIVHGHACSHVHSHTVHPCESDSGVLAKSAHPCLPGL